MKGEEFMEIKEALAKSPDEIKKAIEEKTNNFSFKPKKEAEEIYSDPSSRTKFAMLMARWFRTISEPEMMFDDRNEESVRRARTIRTVSLADNIDSKDREFGAVADDAVKKLSFMHRTLQQSFTKLCLKFLGLYKEDNQEAERAVSMLEAEYGSYWDQLPFI